MSVLITVEISENFDDSNNSIKSYYLKKTLLIRMWNPSKMEKEVFEKGEIVFKIIENPNFFILLFKIGILDWSDIANLEIFLIFSVMTPD